MNSKKQKTKWGFLAFFTIIIITINGYLSFVVSSNELVNPKTLLSYVFGSVLGLPILILVLSQIWKKHRNNRARVKSILYPSLLILLGLVVSFIDVGSKNIEETNEEKNYVFISFLYPNEIKSIFIKETPKSKCEQWRNDYFIASNEKCKNCTILVNECKKTIKEKYKEAFNQKKIDVPYVYKPFKYPEILINEGLPKDSFSLLCSMSKKSLETSMCYE